MEMDALEDAITSLDMVGRWTNEAIAQLLRGLATTITKSLNETIKRNDANICDAHIRLTNVEERCDYLEQYSWRNTVRIRWVAEALHENHDLVPGLHPFTTLSMVYIVSVLIRFLHSENLIIENELQI